VLVLTPAIFPGKCCTGNAHLCKSPTNGCWQSANDAPRHLRTAIDPSPESGHSDAELQEQRAKGYDKEDPGSSLDMSRHSDDFHSQTAPTVVADDQFLSIPSGDRAELECSGASQHENAPVSGLRVCISGLWVPVL
jgi:hypothetical protein